MAVCTYCATRLPTPGSRCACRTRNHNGERGAMMDPARWYHHGRHPFGWVSQDQTCWLTDYGYHRYHR